MTFPLGQAWINRTARWLLPALLVAIVGGRLEAAELSSATSSHAFDAEEHAKNCNCGKLCKKAACCCGPRTPKSRASSNTPVRQMAKPCLESAPCGDSGLPSSPSAGPFGKAIPLSAGLSLCSETLGRLLPSPAPCRLPARRASRLDEPPEHTAVS